MVFIFSFLPDGIVAGEVHDKRVDSCFPDGVFWAWYFAFPFEHVEGAIVSGGWFGDKSIGMILPPLFPLFFESADDELVGFELSFHSFHAS